MASTLASSTGGTSTPNAGGAASSSSANAASLAMPMTNPFLNNPEPILNPNQDKQVHTYVKLPIMHTFFRVVQKLRGQDDFTRNDGIFFSTYSSTVP